MKKQKGITLIALVITIIILLILAGVAINQLGGDNGLIVKARWSEFVMEYERVDEAKELYAMEKVMDRYGQSKFTLKSLFTNISHAEESSDMLYPVDLNKKFYISEALPTLKNTICEVEKLEEYDLIDTEKVNLFRLDIGLLNDIEVKREYVINIVSGMLYYIDGEPYQGKIYHTLRYGSPKDLNGNPHDPFDPIRPSDPTDKKNLIIHYLSGYDNKTYTQKVEESKSENVTLNPIEFTAPANHVFLYWKDVTQEKIGNQQPEETDPNAFVPKNEGYYAIANKLVSILDEMWETDILEIIEEAATYEPDPDDEEAPPDVATQAKNEILDYLSVYESEIQAILESDMSLDGLASWFINNTDYLIKLEEYESENWYEEDEEEEIIYETYSNQEVVNMGGQDMWLEAVWTESPITLDANGGKINRKSKIMIGVKEGEEYGRDLKDAVREGFVFAGWFTERNGGVQKVSTDIFTAADLPERILYAHWVEENSPDLVNLTYDANGGKIRNVSTSTITEKRVKGTRIGTMRIVEKDGLGQGGWYTAREGGTQVEETKVITADMTVYGQWYNVKLELNGGELYCNYTRPDDIEKKYNQWNPVRYGGIYVVNGLRIGRQAGGYQLPGARGYRGVRKVTYVTTPAGKQYGVKSQFKGWFTGQNGTGTKVTQAAKYYDSYGDTLYAHWREKYTINYDANGGQFGTNASNTWKQRYVFIDKRYPGMTKPNRPGYTFAGWYDSPEGGNKVELYNASYLVTGNKTLYAHWEEMKFEVTVLNVRNKNWIQRAVPTSGSLNYYKKTYYISKTKPTDVTSSYDSSQTNGYAYGKEEGTTYYVWAKVTKGGVDTYSSNYVEVKTGHTHSGSPSKGTGCYQGSSSGTCYGEDGYIWASSNYSFHQGTAEKNRKCQICQTTISQKTCYKTSSKPLMHLVCLKCEALYKRANQTMVAYLCESCYAKRERVTLSDGTVYSEAIRISQPIWYDQRADSSTTYGKTLLKHVKVYSLNCGKNEREGSFVKIDF